MAPRILAIAMVAASIALVGASTAAAHHAQPGLFVCQTGLVTEYTATVDSPPGELDAYIPQVFRWDGSAWQHYAYGSWAYKYGTQQNWHLFGSNQMIGSQRLSVPSGYYAVLHWVYDYELRRYESGWATAPGSNYFCQA